jgi:hypothetical protein
MIVRPTRTLALALLAFILTVWPVASVETAAPLESSSVPVGLLIAGGSIDMATATGLVATDLASQRELGHFATGGPNQGDALPRSPDGRRAYLLDRTWLAKQQRALWQLVELELPSLTVLRRTPLDDAIDMLGRARIIAVAGGGGEV